MIIEVEVSVAECCYIIDSTCNVLKNNESDPRLQ